MDSEAGAQHDAAPGGALRATYNALEDAGIRLQDVHKTAVGIFVAGQVSFLPSPDAPDETTLRANIGRSLADSVSLDFFPHSHDLRHRLTHRLFVWGYRWHTSSARTARR
jgi:hypothetical protein